MWERTGVSVQTLEPDFSASRAKHISRACEILYRALNTRTAVAFIGAGCSVPLGYPTWREFARAGVDHALLELRATPQNDELSAEFQRLIRFEQQLLGTNVDTRQLLFILGVCQRAIQGSQSKPAYHDFLTKFFAPPVPPSTAPNPYHALLELPIERFVTCNYDEETEKALTQVHGIPPEEFELRPEARFSKRRRRAFTQQPKHYDQLALFALSRIEQAKYMVFHCHGHYKEPDSMVVTESDYRRWYLSSALEADAFRQTIDLLFSSNPIFFIGFSLQDEDLLRALRMIVANRKDRHARPLFALLPEEEEGADEDAHALLFERYGVNVIPFTSPVIEDRGQDLINALRVIKRDWLAWWDGFLSKPKIRRVNVTGHPPHPYHHYPISHGNNQTLGGKRLEKLLHELKEDAQRGRKAIALTGRGGTGKSWCAQKLTTILQRDSDFTGFFFWSSYYANDALSGLDRALLYLDPKHDFEGDRLERFAQCLKHGRYFLVFDGIERFLIEGDNPESGSGFSPEAKTFLRAIRDPESRSTVVLTSRLWPEDLGSHDHSDNPAVRRFTTLNFSTDDVVDIEPFSWVTRRKDVSALCSLIDGHIYCLALAAYLLRSAGQESADACLKELQRHLADTPPDRRTQRMIKEAIVSLDGKWKGKALALLGRIALFMSPIGIETISAFYGVPGDPGELLAQEQQDLIDALVKSNLLQETVNLLMDPDTMAYTVHPIVRAYIFEQEHRAYFNSSPSFTLPGYTSKTVEVDPGEKERGVRVVIETIDRIELAAEQALIGNRKREAVALCRSMFSVMRARMGANTISRWSDYKSYISLIGRLWDLAKKVSPELWNYVERHDLSSVEDPDSPLYADEMAWLYNEVGLASYSEGVMLNALPIWEQGYEINKVIDSENGSGPYVFQSQLNLGAGYIHSGRLHIAEQYLMLARRTNFVLDDKDYLGRVTGYLALVKHLKGNLKDAAMHYEQALEMLQDAGGNVRAESVFMAHFADLKMRLKPNDADALQLIYQSLYLAESGYHPDLIANAKNSLGHWHRVQGEIKKSINQHNAALIEAQRIGMRRLECDVLAEQSQLYLDLGDPDVARQKAIEALKIANDSALSLKQTRGLVALGKATMLAGQQELGLSYLRHARRLAHNQGYFFKKSEAEDLLRGQGIEPESEDRG